MESQAQGLAFDARNFSSGRLIPSENYCDQPYLVAFPSGDLCCVMTTGQGVEGKPGQHVISLRSTDFGRTWSEPVAIEPADGPEASWAVPLLAPSGRLYVFYTYNARNMREVKADDPPFAGGTCSRGDTLGEYAVKYSDDEGRTWSKERWYLPVRPFAIDYANPYGGEVRFFWGVHKPVMHEGTVYLAFSKVGRFGEGFIAESEACLLRSDDFLQVGDPGRASWETLPEGEHGLKAPEGPISEEPSVAVLSEGSLVCVFRTVAGHPCIAYSRDGGRTWSKPAFMRYFPGGPLVANPRAANFIWKLRDGRFLYWFHNNAGRDFNQRNPAWLAGGVERPGPEGPIIHWGKPEVVLFDEDPETRISYPDLLEVEGRLLLSVTKKHEARLFELESELIQRLFEGF